MATTHPPAKDAITVPFFARVRAALDSFSPTERKLAQVVLDYPINLAGYSASELAQLTGVSNATVTRFIRRLGYDSYEEARRTARLEATTSGLPLPSSGIALSPSTPNCALLWQQLQDNLTATLAQIPASTMDAMASALHQAVSKRLRTRVVSPPAFVHFSTFTPCFCHLHRFLK